jgi:pimeloyl-ACP methyl ester carboxylesterase
MSAEMIPTTVGPLECRRYGEGSPVVLWNSLFVDDRSWARVEEDLASDHQVIVINGPGHGRTGDPGRRYNQDECATAALQVLAAFGVDNRVDWVGNAWGGAVGIVIAARHMTAL